MTNRWIAGRGERNERHVRTIGRTSIQKTTSDVQNSPQATVFKMRLETRIRTPPWCNGKTETRNCRNDRVHSNRKSTEFLPTQLFQKNVRANLVSNCWASRNFGTRRPALGSSHPDFVSSVWAHHSETHFLPSPSDSRCRGTVMANHPMRVCRRRQGIPEKVNGSWVALFVPMDLLGSRATDMPCCWVGALLSRCTCSVWDVGALLS